MNVDVSTEFKKKSSVANAKEEISKKICREEASWNTFVRFDTNI